MDPLIGIGIKCHRLILITDLKHSIFDRAVVQTKRDLLQIAPSTRTIGIVQVCVDSVVSDDGSQGRSLTEPLRGKVSQELRHEMVVALNIKSVHALRRDAGTAVADWSRHWCRQ